MAPLLEALCGPGDNTGRELRFVNGNPARYRRDHLDAVAGEHWNR